MHWKWFNHMAVQIEPHMERAINDKNTLKVEFSQTLIVLIYNTHNKMLISTMVCVKIQQLLPVVH